MLYLKPQSLCLDNTCYAIVILDFIFQKQYICKRISANQKNLSELDPLIFFLRLRWKNNIYIVMGNVSLFHAQCYGYLKAEG